MNYCFNWVAALGHRGGQEFGPPATLTPHSYSIFLCEATLLYFFVVYNFVLFYDLFVSSLLGGVEVAVGRAVELVGKCIAMHRHVCYWKSLLFLCLCSIIRSSLIFVLLLHFHLFCFGTSPHFFPSLNPSLLPSCSPFPLQGGRQVTAVGGRQACHVLLCLGLHQNIPPHVTLATAFPFNHPTVVWRKWQHTSSGQYSAVTPQKVTLTFNSSPLGMIYDLLSSMGRLMFIFDFSKS